MSPMPGFANYVMMQVSRALVIGPVVMYRALADKKEKNHTQKAKNELEILIKN